MGLEDRVEVVILGGGTAGWMAAIALATVLPPSRCRVRLIESDEIGIVGVGEATLPQIRQFNELVQIDEAELLRRTRASFKLGIEFRNWGALNSSYIHPFGIYGKNEHGLGIQHKWLRARQNGHDFNLEDLSFAVAACRRNRFGFPLPSDEIGSTFNYAYHLDASLYAAFLRQVAEARGVLRIEGKVCQVRKHAQTGDLAAVVLESGETIDGDLFVDCSGFRSMLLGSELETGWDDWAKWLPCDRAFAVPSARSADFTPYTRSTARDAGWQWRIPLQHRTGNGYVFSSAFTIEERAAETLLDGLDGERLGEPRLLKFQAGRRTLQWNRNCVGLGLASGFLEPLESTSIYLIQIAVAHLINLFPARRCDPVLRVEFNRRMDVEYARIRDFLILHYHLNSREDAEIWRYCRAMDVPASLTRRIALFKHRGFIERYRDGLFTPPSWLSVFVGQGLVPDHYHPSADGAPLERWVKELEGLRTEIDGRVAALPRHEDILAQLTAAYQDEPPIVGAVG